MKKFHKTLFASLAGALIAGTAIATPASAQLLPLMLLDKGFKMEAEKAYNTPGHVEWCKRQKPGFRPKWNNWRTADGKVEYCASPYYTPPWRKHTSR